MKKLIPFGWGLSVSVGALWIRFYEPQKAHPWLKMLVASEPFHVFAHTMLYGMLGFLGKRFFGEKRALGLVLLLGGIQEGAQVLGERGFGSGEVFDLCVDLSAALVVVFF